MPRFAVNEAVGWRGGQAPAGFDREPVPFWDSAARGFEMARSVTRLGAREEASRAELWRRHQEAERALGKKLAPSSAMIDPLRAEDEFMSFDRVLTDDAYEAELAKLAAEKPGVQIRGLDTVRVAVDQRLGLVQARSAEASEDHPVGEFLGEAAGAMTDPANLMAMVFTGGAGMGRPLLARVLMQGGANAAAEAAQQPFKAVEAHRYGGPAWTPGQAFVDVAAAGVGAAGFEALGGAVEAGAKRVFRGSAQARAAELMDTAALDEAAVGPRDGETFEAVRASLARGEPPPPLEPPKDLGELFGGEGGQSNPMSRTEYRGRPIYAARFDPASVETDAATFQYKADGDAEGVTARLRGVEAWDATASGKVIVYQPIEGPRVIADGHQRRGLARRMVEKGWDAQLDGYLFREADGWTPGQVRVVAALKNIREGSGAILDAAKVFREAPGALDDASLPVSGDFIGRARGLARLSDEAFGAVVNGVIPERYAADIGLLAGGRPDLHAGMVRLLKVAEPANADEAQALVVGALQDDWIKTQGDQVDLFGHDPAESALIARARVAAAVKRTLASDTRLFGQLVKNADAIEAGGNALARDVNEARLAVDRAALEVTARLAMRAGPVGEAMAEAAGKVARGEATAAQAAKTVSKALREALEAGERFDETRASLLAPEPPSAAAKALVEDFDDPAGPAAAEQADMAVIPAARLSGEELGPADAPIKDLRAAAAAFYAEKLLGKQVTNADLGQAVTFGKTGGRKALAVSGDPLKLRLFPALEQIVARGRLVDSQPSYSPAERNIKAYHRLEATVDVGGETALVRVVVREDATGRFYYDHRPVKDDGPAKAEGPETSDALTLPATKSGGVAPEAEASTGNVGPDGDDINLAVEAAEDAPPPGLFDDITAETPWQADAANTLKGCLP